jgi:hypothetical protein
MNCFSGFLLLSLFLWKGFISPSIVKINFVGYGNLAWQLFCLGLEIHYSMPPPCFLMFLSRKLLFFWWVYLCMWLGASLLQLFYSFLILYTYWFNYSLGKVLFWACLFVVLKASCIWITLSLSLPSHLKIWQVFCCYFLEYVCFLCLQLSHLFSYVHDS